jgi:hypothetical protein
VTPQTPPQPGEGASSPNAGWLAASGNAPTAPASGGRLKKWGSIALALFVVLLGAGALYYTSRPNPPTYDVGSCVQESGGKADPVACSDPDAYQIISKQHDHSQCPDPNQPYATRNGTVLCLKKR